MNHFGTRVFVSQLKNVASQYRTAYPEAMLAINDMSLTWGGLFDIGASWAPPHRTHRLGNTADVRLVPVANRPRLVQIIQMQGLRIHPEPETNHWHLY